MCRLCPRPVQPRLNWRWARVSISSDGVVVMVDAKLHAPNGVGVRIGTGSAWHVVWPLYLAVHRDPRQGEHSCRRCDTMQREARLEATA